MLKMKYLTEANLRGFEKYKYNCIDTSILSVYVMHPFWNYCVRFFPTWVAPNLITFLGFLLTVVNFFLIGFYDFDFTIANSGFIGIPRWVWLVAGVNVFVAYTLDGIDGKQARRTGTSGPLGELFDHGLDSYSAVLIPIYIFTLFGTGTLSTTRMHFAIWIIFLNFYLTHFEKYNTGVMFLPWGYDFTMWTVTFTLALTCVVGPQVWLSKLPFGLYPSNIFEILMYTSGSLTSHPIIIMNIYKSYKNKTGKMRPFLEAIRPLMPFVGFFIVTSTWVLFSNNKISDLTPRCLFVIFGTVFSNFCCRLIVAQMSETRCEAWNHLMSPVLIATIVSCFPYKYFNFNGFTPEIETYIVYFLTVYSTLVHLHYGQGVVREMCDHFKIKCFKVRENYKNGHAK